MQEDKQPLFDALETTGDCVQMATELIRGAEFNKEQIAAKLSTGFITATELADYLVTKDIPFRDAHQITGKLVSCAEENKCQLHELPLSTLRAYCPEISEDVFGVLDPMRSTARKRSAGSTAISQVHKQIEEWKQQLSQK
jgi:argininosuccinate lyase